CSATKRSDPDPIPALARYDGPLWRTLRAGDPAIRRARVAFLSAHYGFRAAASPIASHDGRLTPAITASTGSAGRPTRCARAPAPPPPAPSGLPAPS
ncbi:hypothetical protein MKK50_14225, partial [Methylobacterium sp. J-043]|nr:hypothetical protein [Methylobacterium sp. J-043]